jgi:hypothetical protein
MNLILWVLSEISWSIADSFRKKAIDNSKLWKSSFSILGSIIGLILLFIFIFSTWEKILIFNDFIAIFIVLVVSLTQVYTNFTYIKIYEKVKISELLPYWNIWSLFTVIVWFFLFFGTENETSLITFIITLLTIFIVFISDFNKNKLKISKHILMYIFALILDSIVFMTLWYLLLDYSSLDYMTLTLLIDFILYLVLIFITKETINLIFKQNKQFYKSRFFSIILWRLWFFIWLYIIETSWVLIATLISFLWIVFSILSMKFILKDNPTKKQVLVAFWVTILIWIWYYFK